MKQMHVCRDISNVHISWKLWLMIDRTSLYKPHLEKLSWLESGTACTACEQNATVKYKIHKVQQLDIQCISYNNLSAIHNDSQLILHNNYILDSKRTKIWKSIQPLHTVKIVSVKGKLWNLIAPLIFWGPCTPILCFVFPTGLMRLIIVRYFADKLKG
jgi:hypothetical protein